MDSAHHSFRLIKKAGSRRIIPNASSTLFSLGEFKMATGACSVGALMLLLRIMSQQRLVTPLPQHTFLALLKPAIFLGDPQNSIVGKDQLFTLGFHYPCLVIPFHLNPWLPAKEYHAPDHRPTVEEPSQ